MMAALVVWIAGFAAILGLIRVAIGWVAAADNTPRPALRIPVPAPEALAGVPAAMAVAVAPTPAPEATATVPEPLQPVD